MSPDPPEKEAEIAYAAIVNASSNLYSAIDHNATLRGLDVLPTVDQRITRDKIDSTRFRYSDILHEFQQSCAGPWHVMENYGSEIYYVRSMETFLAAAISWNKHVFSNIRSARGEISRQMTSDGVQNITAIVYESDSTTVIQHIQDFNFFAQPIHMFITSPLRNMQSMLYVQEYYESLVEEVRLSIAHLNETGRVDFKDRQLAEKG